MCEGPRSLPRRRRPRTKRMRRHGGREATESPPPPLQCSAGEAVGTRGFGAAAVPSSLPRVPFPPGAVGAPSAVRCGVCGALFLSPSAAAPPRSPRCCSSRRRGPQTKRETGRRRLLLPILPLRRRCCCCAPGNSRDTSATAITRFGAAVSQTRGAKQPPRVALGSSLLPHHDHGGAAASWSQLLLRCLGTG